MIKSQNLRESLKVHRNVFTRLTSRSITGPGNTCLTLLTVLELGYLLCFSLKSEQKLKELRPLRVYDYLLFSEIAIGGEYEFMIVF